MSALCSAVLYLLALNATWCATLAWGDASALTLASWAIALAAAQLVGQQLGEAFASIEARRRDRMAVFLGTLQLSVLVLALVLAAGSPTPGLLRFLTNVLSGFLLLVLGLARLAPQPRGVVGQALALAALAGFHGGTLAAWAAGSTLALVAVYVGLDHRAQLLAAHRLEPGPNAVGAALRGSALLALPVALAVGWSAYAAAPDPRRIGEPRPLDGSYRSLEQKTERTLDRNALRAMVLAGLAGAVAVYVVGRLLVRSQRGEPKAIETPEPLRGGLEPIPPVSAPTRAGSAHRGWRGRIVEAYLALLHAAERAGFPREPHETPAEFAAALGEPRAPLASATEEFVCARYGAFEVGADELTRMKGSVEAVLQHLRRVPPRSRRKAVQDVAASRVSKT